MYDEAQDAVDTRWLMARVYNSVMSCPHAAKLLLVLTCLASLAKIAVSTLHHALRCAVLHGGDGQRPDAGHGTAIGVRP